MTELQAYSRTFQYFEKLTWWKVREMNAFGEDIQPPKSFEDRISAQMYVLWRVEDLAREEREFYARDLTEVI